MNVLQLHREIIEYARKRNIEKKLYKQISTIRENINHPSLHVELLEPKHLRFFSFRIDRKYRAIFIFRNKETIEIISITDHYH
jgi:plasmid maintenance system killer protein